MIAFKKQDKTKTFKDLEPLKFNEKSEDIGQQIKDLENIVKKDFGQGVKKNSEYISFTQLRSLYDKIKQCNEANELAILYPKIVYMAARQSKNEGKELVMQIARFIKTVKVEDEKQSKENLKSFKKFIEAIVAYQKYYYPSNK